MAQDLPVDTHNLLVDAYNDWKDQNSPASRDALLSRLVAVHEAGWNQSSISRSLGLSRERVRQFMVETDARSADLPVYRGEIAPPPPVTSRRSPGHPSVYPEVIDSYVERLLELQPLATRARGHHGPDSPERQASDEYSMVLKEAVDEHIPVTVLAARVGRSHAGLRTRLRTADRIGKLGTPGARNRDSTRDPVVVERWAKKLRPLLDASSAGGVNVDRKKSARATALIREAVDPPNNVSIRALAEACGRSYHSVWVRYLSDVPETRAS